MKGWKTLAFNGAVIIGGAALQWVAGVNWAEYVGPTTAVLLTAAANMGLRMVTNTPVGKAD